MKDVLSWDSLNRLHKINNHLSAVASEIEELGVNMFDAGTISDKLQIFSGITLWKLRDICDFMHMLEVMEVDTANLFENYLDGEVSREEWNVIPDEYCI